MMVLGRKGRLFSGIVHGAVASANPHSLVEIAEAKGLKSHAYPARPLERLPRLTTVDDDDAVLPWNIKPVLASIGKRADIHQNAVV